MRIEARSPYPILHFDPYIGSGYSQLQ